MEMMLISSCVIFNVYSHQFHKFENIDKLYFVITDLIWHYVYQFLLTIKFPGKKNWCVFSGIFPVPIFRLQLLVLELLFDASSREVTRVEQRNLQGDHHCGSPKPLTVKTHLDGRSFLEHCVGKIVCKTFIYLYVCMHAAAHNYTTHKSMYTWVVIADANWCSGLLSSEKRRAAPSWCHSYKSFCCPQSSQRHHSQMWRVHWLLSLRLLGCKTTLSTLSRAENSATNMLPPGAPYKKYLSKFCPPQVKVRAERDLTVH